MIVLQWKRNFKQNVHIMCNIFILQITCLEIIEIQNVCDKNAKNPSICLYL